MNILVVYNLWGLLKICKTLHKQPLTRTKEKVRLKVDLGDKNVLYLYSNLTKLKIEKNISIFLANSLEIILNK